MSDLYPGLQITLIEDDPYKENLLAEQFDTFGVSYLGRLASNDEVFAAFDQIKADPNTSNLITEANLLMIDGNLDLGGGGCGDGNQILGHLIRTKLAIPPSYYHYVEDQPFPRVAFGCSADPKNAYAAILGDFNFDVYQEPPAKLRGMFQIATMLLREGAHDEPVIP